MVDFDSGREERLAAHLQNGGVATGGITVRDYFAARSLEATLNSMGDIIVTEDLAKRAYEIADAMMAERDKKNVKQCSVEEAFGL